MDTAVLPEPVKCIFKCPEIQKLPLTWKIQDIGHQICVSFIWKRPSAVRNGSQNGPSLRAPPKSQRHTASTTQKHPCASTDSVVGFPELENNNNMAASRPASRRRMTPSQRRRSRNRLRDYKSDQSKSMPKPKSCTASVQTDLTVLVSDGRDNTQDNDQATKDTTQGTNVESNPKPHVGESIEAAASIKPSPPLPDHGQQDEEQCFKTELHACTAFLEACATAESCFLNPPVNYEEIKSALVKVTECHVSAQESLNDENIDPTVKIDMMNTFSLALQSIECMMTPMPSYPPSGYPPPAYPPPGYPPMYPRSRIPRLRIQ